MNNSLEIMLNKYNPQNSREKENAIKEILQEVALSGLSHGGFFKKAAFYGGTCLRIFHGLNRFSEDLDFALVENDSSFKLSDYFPFLIKEFASFGIDMNIETKEKNIETDIQSAFLKGNTQILMMTFFPKTNEIEKIIFNQKIKVKFEIDVDNPKGGITETRYQLLPSPYQIKIFDESTLFAGKIAALICRNYKSRIKGRDYYDFLFYVSKGSTINLEYLENKLKDNGIIDQNNKLTLNEVKELLTDRFNNTDFEMAKKDVAPFIKNSEDISIWCSELFISTLDALKGR